MRPQGTRDSSRIAVQPRYSHLGLSAALSLSASFAAAAEFRSTIDAATVLYDAPSVKSRPLFVVSRGYPVEVMVNLEGWTKVRDAGGSVVWIESKALTQKRMVVVRRRVAEVRATPEDSAAVAFKVAQHVLLELIETASPGWVKVRHSDGGTGFIRTAEIWGT
jgi:SH3-like domain-containing protein